jgi:hypothetical protein
MISDDEVARLAKRGYEMSVLVIARTGEKFASQ